MLFLVKVRIDLEKLPELGKKIQNNDLDLGYIKSTYCLQSEPSVGISIWECTDRDEFERVFSPHKDYYSEIMEVTPVITSEESKMILMKQISE